MVRYHTTGQAAFTRSTGSWGVEEEEEQLHGGGVEDDVVVVAVVLVPLHVNPLQFSLSLSLPRLRTN